MPPRNFSWFVEGRLAALGLPSTRADIEFLWSNGVKRLISLTESRPSLHGFPLTHVHIPIEDFTPPSIEQVNKFLGAVETANSEEEAVAVHCHLGMGRTGTMLACYLVKTTHCNAQEAINTVRKRRPGSIETDEQEQLVQEFSEWLLPGADQRM